MKLSIIIALYNTQSYIEKCIRSIYDNNSLDINSFEVIVINDGSTDNSESIVTSLLSEFGNIRLINKNNGGQSSARNLGFYYARGKYILCLDSDDSIDASLLEELLNSCFEDDLDALSFNYTRVSEQHTLLPRGKDCYLKATGIYSGSEFLNKFTISGIMWRYFYRTKIIKDNHLKMIEGIQHEDEEFIIQFLSYAEKVSYSNVKFYNYLIRSNSTTNNSNKEHRIKLIYDILKVVESLDSRILELKDNDLMLKGVSKKKEQLLVSILLRMKTDNLSNNEINLILNKMESKGLYPLDIKHSNLKFKILSIMLNHRLLLHTFIRL